MSYPLQGTPDQYNPASRPSLSKYQSGPAASWQVAQPVASIVTTARRQHPQLGGSWIWRSCKLDGPELQHNYLLDRVLAQIVCEYWIGVL
jgi:hypothetical protein